MRTCSSLIHEAFFVSHSTARATRGSCANCSALGWLVVCADVVCTTNRIQETSRSFMGTRVARRILAARRLAAERKDLVVDQDARGFLRRVVDLRDQLFRGGDAVLFEPEDHVGPAAQ